jgi:hypothetical protein
MGGCNLPGGQKPRIFLALENPRLEPKAEAMGSLEEVAEDVGRG